MYNSFFGLTETPFNLTPDPRYLFLSSNHREAIDHLLYGINERKGFILITGGVGAGKTTLCRVLLDRLDSKTKSALILNSFISDIELLKLIVEEFGVSIEPDRECTKKDYIDALNKFLLDNFSNDGNAVLLIDEAQNLSRDVLEQLRMLSNLETEREKLIQIVLIGQPELNDIVSSPSLRQLNDRITVRYFLNPLGETDIKGYIEHRLVVAGGHGNITFTKGACRKLYLKTNGIPRKINSICDRALLIAYAKESFTVTGKIIEQAATDLYGLNTAAAGPGTSWLRPAVITAAAVIIIAAAATAGFGLRGLFSDKAVSAENSLITAESQAQVRGAISDKVKENFHEPDVKLTGSPEKQAEPLLKEEETVPETDKTSSLFIDEKESIRELFTAFYSDNPDKIIGKTKSSLSLVNFELEPEYYIMLKKTFRIKTAENNGTKNYLLITEVNEDGAVCQDDKGNLREISREFLLNNWSGTVSWVYPFNRDDVIFNIGLKDPAVTEIQEILKKIGYMVRITGIYDMETFLEMKRFQKDFGLQVDGAAGPRTRALLFQMAG